MLWLPQIEKVLYGPMFYKFKIHRSFLVLYSSFVIVHTILSAFMKSKHVKLLSQNFLDLQYNQSHTWNRPGTPWFVPKVQIRIRHNTLSLQLCICFTEMLDSTLYPTSYIKVEYTDYQRMCTFENLFLFPQLTVPCTAFTLVLLNTCVNSLYVILNWTYFILQLSCPAVHTIDAHKQSLYSDDIYLYIMVHAWRMKIVKKK